MFIYRVHGFVLLSVLIFLQIMTAFAIGALLMNKRHIKLLAEEIQQKKDMNQAKSKLIQIEKKLFSDGAKCLIKPVSTISLMTASPDWWELHGCREDNENLSLFYIVEHEGEDPCAILDKNNDNQYLVGNYYRITLLALSKDRPARMMLQSVAVLPVKASVSCDQKVRKIQAGRQQYQEF